MTKPLYQLTKRTNGEYWIHITLPSGSGWSANLGHPWVGSLADKVLSEAIKLQQTSQEDIISQTTERL